MTTAYSAPPQVGWQPLAIVPMFSLGEDWIVTLESSDLTFEWPIGTTVTAEIDTTPPTIPEVDPPLPPQFSWPGVVTGGSVSFDVPYTDCDQITQGSLMRVMVKMPSAAPDGFDHYVWAQGKVYRRDGW